MMSVVAARYDPDVEAALIGHYGVAPEQVSLRRLRVLVERLPPGAWPDAEEQAFWSNEAHLVAGLIDATNMQTWVLQAGRAADAQKAPPPKPKPIPRPAKQPKRATWGDLARMLEGAG